MHPSSGEKWKVTLERHVLHLQQATMVTFSVGVLVAAVSKENPNIADEDPMLLMQEKHQKLKGRLALGIFLAQDRTQPTSLFNQSSAGRGSH